MAHQPQPPAPEVKEPQAGYRTERILHVATGEAAAVRREVTDRKGKNTCVYFLVLAALAGFVTPEGRCQQMSSFDRARALEMLDDIAQDVRKHYYDPTFHGVDWDAKVREAKQKIEGENSLNLSLAHIAAALDALNDSHTCFLPPPRPYRHDYGFQTQMIGDRCYVTRVRPGSDAEAKGVKPGDEVLALEGRRPNRAILWKMDYRLKILRPQSGLQLTLCDPEGRNRQVDVLAKFEQLKRVSDISFGGADFWDPLLQMENLERLLRAQAVEKGDELMILKLPEFIFNESEVEGLMNKARKHQALVLDLRGNPGGAIERLKYLLGRVFENEVKIADRTGRKESKPEVAKPKGGIFTGKLVVLVDSNSGSAAELFARIVQLEKRGIVMGDQTSGRVMEAKMYNYKVGYDIVVFFGAMITQFDLIMSDGRSLEGTGVTPDEILLPTAADLAVGRDPVLSRAAAICGVRLTAEDAGKLFPFEWPKE
jgi:carboxyl-terminal processing protease